MQTGAMFVLTITQRDEAAAGDQVAHLLAALPAHEAAHPLSRSWGAEVVGGVEDPATAVHLALAALRIAGTSGRRWSVGLGVGRVEQLPDGALAGPGAARSRRAVEAAAKAHPPLGVEAGPAGVGFDGVPLAPESAAAAQATLRLIGDLVTRRSEAEWAVVDLLVPGVRGQQKAVAESLGISVQAVSQAVSRAQFAQEWDGRAAAALLLRLAAFAVD